MIFFLVKIHSVYNMVQKITITYFNNEFLVNLTIVNYLKQFYNNNDKKLIII